MDDQSDWASNPCLGPRRKNLRLGACMGVFSQLFDWNRATRFLGPGADVQMSPSHKQAEIDRRAIVKPPVLGIGLKTITASRQGLGHAAQDWEGSTEAAMAQLGSVSVIVSDSSSREIALELRQLLHAKQEPFVLQDVIREKRQPVRIKSSGEVKFGAYQTGQATRRSQNSKKAKANDSRKVRADSGCGKPPASKSVAHKSITDSAAVVQRSNRAPAESMVAMPSNQAVCGQSVKKAPTKGTCKVASPGRNPIKSPNKKALLMEAAAKILEGSNRSRKPLNSVRSLLAELDGKHAQEKPREKLLKAISLQKELSGKQEMSSQNIVRRETLVEGKKHFSKQKAHTTSGGKQIRSSSEDHPGMSQRLDKDLLTMQSRVNDSEALTTLATPAHSPVLQEVYVQRPGGHILHRPGMERREEGTADAVNQAVKGREGSSLRSFLQRRAIQRERAAAVLPKVIMEDPPRLEHKACINESEDLAPKSRGSKKDFSFSSLTCTDGVPEHGLFNCNDEMPHNTSFGGSPAEYLQDYDVPMVKFAASHIACDTDAARHKARCEDSEEELQLDAGESSQSFTGAADVVVQSCCLALDAGHVKMEQPSTNMDELCMSAEVDGIELLTTGKNPNILRLCDYSWWEREDYQIIITAEEEGDRQLYRDPPDASHQFSKDCDEYTSPTTVRSPFVVKVFEEGRDTSNIEGELSIAPDYTCMDEFQQSSPVSVLDAVFEEDSPTSGNSFACFEEARQQLLENVRRYEMLAQMDLHMLMKLTEEQSCSELEEESDGPNFEELRETDATDMSVTSSQEQASSSFVYFPEFHSSWNEGDLSGVEAQGWERDNESYVCLFEESHYGISLDSDAERHLCHLQELGDKDFRPASDCTFDLIERLKEGERLSCKVFFDCLGEALEPHALGVPNHVVEAHPWTSVPKDMLEDLGKPAFSSALGVVDALVQTDLGCAGTRNWRDFCKEVEEMGIELESTLFGILMHELLSDLLQES